MTYFFLLLGACQESAKKEVIQSPQTVKFAKFNINATCVVDKDEFQKMFVLYQNQIQTCFANTSEKTLDIKVQVKNGIVESIPSTTAPCLKGLMEKWKFDAKCSSDLTIQIRPAQ